MPDQAVWQALLDDELNDRTAANGYSYVFVTEQLPETLTLRQDGKVVLKTPVNTGIASRPTAPGTYPAYLHLSSATMSGMNPDGSHDGILASRGSTTSRAATRCMVSSGPVTRTSRSLAASKFLTPTAALIWPHVQIGTLVTVSARRCCRRVPGLSPAAVAEVSDGRAWGEVLLSEPQDLLRVEMVERRRRISPTTLAATPLSCFSTYSTQW